MMSKRSSLAAHRLPAARREVDDREPAVHQTDQRRPREIEVAAAARTALPAPQQNAVIIGPAMLQHAAHLGQCGMREGLRLPRHDAADPAHGSVLDR